MTRVLALEASTSSAKAIVYDADAGVQSVVTENYAPECADIVTQDIEGVYDTVIGVARRALEQSPGRIDAICISNIWHSLLLLDAKREPLGRMTTWANTDGRATAARFRQDAQFTQWYYQKTGCMVHSLYPLWQYYHLKEQDHPLIERARYLSSQGEFLFERLTGAINYSMCAASGSGMMNTHSLSWDEDVLRFAGIDPGMMPELIEPGDSRPLSMAGARALGLEPGVPVVIGGADGALNQIGSGCMEQGMMTFSVGTSAAIRLAAEKPVLPADQPSNWCYYLGQKRWIVGAATAGSGNCLGWFLDNVTGRQMSYTQLDALAARVNPDDAPVFLPFLYGERCPGWRDDRAGGFLGLRASHGVPEMYYAILEGVLMTVYQCYLPLRKLAGEPKQIRISGGIKKTDVWLNMAVSLFGREMITSVQEHASTMGAVAWALHAAGALPRLEDFDSPIEREVFPDAEKHRQLQKRYERYLEAYNAGG